jgi:hypothetical protein
MTMPVGMGEKTKHLPKRPPSAQSLWRAATGTRGSVVSSIDWAKVLGELAADEAVKTRSTLDVFASSLCAMDDKIREFASQPGLPGEPGPPGERGIDGVHGAAGPPGERGEDLARQGRQASPAASPTSRPHRTMWR